MKHSGSEKEVLLQSSALAYLSFDASDKEDGTALLKMADALPPVQPEARIDAFCLSADELREDIPAPTDAADAFDALSVVKRLSCDVKDGCPAVPRVVE